MKIHSAIAYVNEHVPAAGKEIHYTACGAMEGNQYIRKAHSMFGWDWGPQLPDMGIWRDIFIDSYEKAELSDLHIRQEHIDGKVFLSAETKVMLPEKAQDGEIAEAEYLVLPQSAESNARILKESVGNNDSTLAENADNLEVKITLQTPDGKQISFRMENVWLKIRNSGGRTDTVHSRFIRCVRNFFWAENFWMQKNCALVCAH